MFPCTKKVTIGNEEIVCKDFTYGYMVGVENGTIEDTTVNAVINGTGLTEEAILKFRVSEVDMLFKAIMQLTYPHAYNEDGSLKTNEDEPSEDKKKV